MKHYAYKRLSLALLLTLFSGMLWAQIPEGYYDSAEGKTGPRGTPSPMVSGIYTEPPARKLAI